ncbi:glutaredoxin [Microstroma glucosiphilum]|uniref:glutathione peroxidase n=1 Tax=Pseudomicrostroma glucosiphilum TaxID=1684307 RepID=A0A316UGI7_9BASI|nr:glutaredoxin [Pseudomicrostroma glucosiphilum]PWN23471.1 glutaredoxin [Pseudomicrostroma glucosiphilum]
MAAKQFAEFPQQKLISEKLVAVFSKSYCPYCRQAKGVIANLGLPESKVGIVELDHESEGSDIQAYLADKTGQRTVPNIFINGKHLGGCSDILQAEQSGELKKLVA